MSELNKATSDIERAARVCVEMVVGGRAWNHDQEVAANVLFEAAKRIRALASSEPGNVALHELEELDAYLEGSEDIDANGGPNVAMRVRQVLASALPALRADGWLPRGDAVTWALRAATDWIEHAPHGDDCFVSDHYEGDPGNRCNCGKEGALQMIEDAHPPTAATPVGIVGERGDVSWRSEQILPVGTKLYAASTQPEQVRELDESAVEQRVAKAIADAIGHGMSEKCYDMAKAALAALREPRA